MLIKSYIFWDKMTCSLLTDNQSFGRICHLQLQGWRESQARHQHEASSVLIPCLAYSSTLQMETARSSKRLVEFQWTILHYIPDDWTSQKHCCENLKSYMNVSLHFHFVTRMVWLNLHTSIFQILNNMQNIIILYSIAWALVSPLKLAWLLKKLLI